MVPQIVNLSAKAAWDRGTHFTVQVRDFQPFHVDEPENMGGSNSAPNPLEYILSGLCACTGIMIQKIAHEMNYQLDGIEIEASGSIDPRGFMGTARVSPHFQEVYEEIRLLTTESEERTTELRRQVEERCPAINLFKDAHLEPRATWSVTATV